MGHDSGGIFDPELAKLYEGHPTGFENDEFFWSYVFWLTDEQLRDPALRAVVGADQANDPQPIIDFLNCEPHLTPYGCRLIADFMTRHRKQKRGPKAVPIYALSQQDAVRAQALERARLLLGTGTDKDAAFELAAGEFDISAETLHAYAENKLGSTRRMRNRRKPALNSRK